MDRYTIHAFRMFREQHPELNHEQTTGRLVELGLGRMFPLLEEGRCPTCGSHDENEHDVAVHIDAMEQMRPKVA